MMQIRGKVREAACLNEIDLLEECTENESGEDLTQIRRGRRLLGKVFPFCRSYLHLSRVYLFRTF